MRCTKKCDPNCCSDCGPFLPLDSHPEDGESALDTGNCEMSPTQTKGLTASESCENFGHRQSDSSQWGRAAEPILPGLQLSNTNYPNFARQQHLDRPLHYVNNSHFVTSSMSFSQALCAPPSHDTLCNFRSQPQTRPLEFGLRHVGEMVQPVISTPAQRPQSEESWIASRRELLSGGFSYSHAEVRHVSKPPPVALDLGHSCPIPPAAQRPSPTGAALTEAELKAQWLSREMGESPPLP